MQTILMTEYHFLLTACFWNISHLFLLPNVFSIMMYMYSSTMTYNAHTAYLVWCIILFADRGKDTTLTRTPWEGQSHFHRSQVTRLNGAIGHFQQFAGSSSKQPRFYHVMFCTFYSSFRLQSITQWTSTMTAFWSPSLPTSGRDQIILWCKDFVALAEHIKWRELSQSMTTITLTDSTDPCPPIWMILLQASQKWIATTSK